MPISSLRISISANGILWSPLLKLDESLSSGLMTFVYNVVVNEQLPMTPLSKENIYVGLISSNFKAYFH